MIIGILNVTYTNMLSIPPGPALSQCHFVISHELSGSNADQGAATDIKTEIRP
jgi:hypothetical protein